MLSIALVAGAGVLGIWSTAYGLLSRNLFLLAAGVVAIALAVGAGSVALVGILQRLGSNTQRP